MPPTRLPVLSPNRIAGGAINASTGAATGPFRRAGRVSIATTRRPAGQTGEGRMGTAHPPPSAIRARWVAARQKAAGWRPRATSPLVTRRLAYSVIGGVAVRRIGDLSLRCHSRHRH